MKNKIFYYFTRKHVPVNMVLQRNLLQHVVDILDSEVTEDPHLELELGEDFHHQLSVN